MNWKIIGLSIITCSGQIALANPEGTSPLIVFRAGATRTREVIATRDGNIAAPDKAFEFIPINGDRNAEHYTHLNGSNLVYDYVEPAPVVRADLTAEQAQEQATADRKDPVAVLLDALLKRIEALEAASAIK